MSSFAALVENETLKIIRRRRFMIILGILVAIIAVSSYAQYRQYERRQGRDWRVESQQTITRYQNMLRSGRMNPSWARSLRAEVARLQFYVDRGIEPDRPTAPMFTRLFANVAGFLLLPLLIAVLGSDIVSAETAEGTDKLLLTRPIRRWKVLASKMTALFLFTTLTLVCGALLAYSVGSIALDPRGWDAPTFNGFVLSPGGIDVAEVRQLPLWQDALIAYGLEWFAILTVAAIALMLSVIFRTSAASMGTMLASLIGGTIITRISPDWTAGKYLFVSALPLADYYSGSAPPYDGMTLGFCVTLLAIWGSVALLVAFVLYTRRDIFG